ncbi:MAG TPA: AI-2E family transporter, partial [Longimicrobiales bacterium]|nr:AI-2E family transporter [Longimicrobiales bacterium]
IRELIPRERRDAVVSFISSYDDLLSRYLRGQITVALIVGTITGLGLWIARFPYAFLIGAVVAVFSVVPYLGLLLSLIPAVIVALLSGDVLASLAKVAVVYGIAQGLEGSLISPKIVGDSVGLHPVWVVLALAVGGFFFGFVGLLIAVPVAVGVKLAVVRGLERYESSELYGGATAGSD